MTGCHGFSTVTRVLFYFLHPTPRNHASKSCIPNGARSGSAPGDGFPDGGHLYNGFHFSPDRNSSKTYVDSANFNGTYKPCSGRAMGHEWRTRTRRTRKRTSFFTPYIRDAYIISNDENRFDVHCVYCG